MHKGANNTWGYVSTKAYHTILLGLYVSTNAAVLHGSPHQKLH